MSEKRPFDAIIFGGSGYTGCYVIQELSNNPQSFKWCIAGRNRSKLRNTLDMIEKITDKNLQDVEIIEADVENPDSILNMCKQTRLVINCVGPYRFFGEKIVSACIESNTHHIDVSGEPQFLENMQVKYFNDAKEKELYIVGACGFDSIPCDLGIEVLKKEFNGDVNAVETYLQLKGSKSGAGNFGTWQSAIYGLAHASELKSLRRELKEKLFTKSRPQYAHPLRKRPVVFNSEIVEKWCIPFIGSDRSIVLRTQLFNYQFQNEKPVQVQTYMTMKSLVHAIVTLFFGLIFFVMTRFRSGRHTLEKYPELFSCGAFTKNPPPLKRVYEGSFKMTLVANGWSEKLQESTDEHAERPDKKLTMVVNGPDPYEATAICVVNSAAVLLAETDKLPERGGVFTPGAAFRDTSLADKLKDRGLTFTVAEA